MHEVYSLPYQSSTKVNALEQTREVEASNGHNVSGNLAIALLPPSIPPIHTHVSIPNLGRTTFGVKKGYNEQGQFLVISIIDPCLSIFFYLFNRKLILGNWAQVVGSMQKQEGLWSTLPTIPILGQLKGQTLFSNKVKLLDKKKLNVILKDIYNSFPIPIPLCRMIGMEVARHALDDNVALLSWSFYRGYIIGFASFYISLEHMDGQMQIVDENIKATCEMKFGRKKMKLLKHTLKITTSFIFQTKCY